MLGSGNILRSLENPGSDDYVIIREKPGMDVYVDIVREKPGPGDCL